jgi:hypothetical protein
VSWGAAFGQACSAVSGSVKDTALSTVATIQQAAGAVRQVLAAAAQGAANVAGFGARAVSDTAWAAGRAGAQVIDKSIEASPFLGKAYIATKKISSPSKPPRATVIEPCPDTVEGKRKRLEKRNALISLGSAPRGTPEQKAAAERLARNNKAVELARLSEDSYERFRPERKQAIPVGWNKLSDAEVREKGIDPKLLADSKAVIYQTPADWPGGQQTVLAFRGTEPSEEEDLKTNLKQAIGEETVQYKAAKELGKLVARKFDASVLVTGHSLGGGKAQVAGASGKLKGMMFNAAGIHPNTVDGALPDASQYTQFRAAGDPLTGIQNSAGLQAGVGLAGAVAMPFGATATVGNFLAKRLGMPSLSPAMADAASKATTTFPSAMGNLFKQGNLLPPAIGKVVVAPSLDDGGKDVPASDLLGQHSVHNLVNGIEREKSEDVATLQATL